MNVADTYMRRPLRSRQTRWASALAEWLARRGAVPNQISCASVVFAGLAGGCLVLAPTTAPPAKSALFVAAAGLVQLRLLCNLLDGMVAIEGGRKTKSGEVFNDLPDRLSDSLILLGAGYAIGWEAWGATLGWAAALLAVLTAYVRVLGVSAGARPCFLGPMAKQHRMALMTAACLATALESAIGSSGSALAAGLCFVVVGCIVTIARRTRRIVADLEAP
jgi:phosphatidylglycerophosphate synthase